MILIKDRRNKMVYRVVYALLLASVAVFLAFWIDGVRPLHAASLKYTLFCGETKQLTRAGAVWKSKNPSVARVSESGLVTAVKNGTATVIAKAGKRKYRYKIKVENPWFQHQTVELAVNQSRNVKLRGTTREFIFSSSDPSVLRIEKKSRNKIRITALQEGSVAVTASYQTVSRSCQVNVVSSGPAGKDSSFSLYYQGKIIQTLTYNRSDVAKYVSSISNFGQSAPLYMSVNGGDGLESIYAATNNGNVNVPGVKLSEEARAGTIAKACLWARAVCDSQYHGFDTGQRHEPDSWGIAKEDSPGTGDYCCFTLAECAYYFAGVNLLGECLGNPEAAIYPPYSTMLFEHGGVSFWGDTKPRGTAPYDSVYYYPKAGFTEITDQVKSEGAAFVYQAGDIAVSAKTHQHEQLIIKAGTAKNCQVAEACGPGSGGRKGGDQSGAELCVYNHLYKPGEVNHVYRFTGEGVVLNTAGLVQ